MKERPILFSGPMVRAILQGCKTQTRRAVKPWLPAKPSGKPLPDDLAYLSDFTCYRTTCPYGQPGDRLWVREHWATDIQFDRIPPRELPTAYAVRYLADGDHRSGLGDADGKDRRAFHMPRWASRLLLEIVSVRVERLNCCSEADAVAEGADPIFYEHGSAADQGLIDLPLMEVGFPYRNGYAALWEQINGPDSWAANPWVWVVEFKRVDINQ